ncbi:hypothetical protein H206_05428 [Candidatus Electrothrix aarhusensis]|uniref:Uncharacterized protein n=1 Tax=Candidatus Electrothrix aarhusensis TaxID=1859131 RepID=A0A444J4N4_9BACT|nr:hypothetical protein H206_05428 [Candidatus Electrothrix aarhusensis]
MYSYFLPTAEATGSVRHQEPGDSSPRQKASEKRVLQQL